MGAWIRRLTASNCGHSRWSRWAEGAASLGQQQRGALGKLHRGLGVNPELWGGTQEGYIREGSFCSLGCRRGDGRVETRNKGSGSTTADVRARWRGWKGIIWLVSGLGYSGLRSASSFNVGAEGVTTVSGSSAASLARDTSFRTHRRNRVSVRGKSDLSICFQKRISQGRAHTLYPRALSSLVEQGYRSMNLYLSTSSAVSLPSYSSLKAANRRRSTFRILARSPMLLSKARNRAQTSLHREKWTKQWPTIIRGNSYYCTSCASWNDEFHYPDFSWDKLPEVRTRSNRTLVLLSSESDTK